MWIAAAWIALAGCGAPQSGAPAPENAATEASEAPPPEAVTPAPPPAPPVASAPASTASDPAPAPPPAGGDGAACLAAEACESGVCEGLGCDEGHPGTCAPVARGCTRDLRPYCGCDGVTFTSSGSCPGRRYAAVGPCAGDPLPPLPGAG